MPTPNLLSQAREYKQNKTNKSHNTSVGGGEGKGIHNRLYQEKDKYFEKKRFVNTKKEEEELKECTF
jgi:hypothetical protein